ncbi:MAG: phosphonoacetaldehyde hydrolase [Lachnospiraceae bacterium]
MGFQKEIKLAVFDWAGTTVDYGSSAPMEVFHRVFTKAGIQLSREQINGPMGKEKKEHIRELLSLPSATEQWKLRYGRDWNEKNVDWLYECFEETLAQVVAEYSTPIDGVVETIAVLRKKRILIGSTTGYNSEMMQRVIPVAKAAGYNPDCVVTPDVTGKGRPTPFMLYECMRQFQVYPPSAVVKVGDTVTDILEGKNGGAWSIGILMGSNVMGLTREEAERIGSEELEKRKSVAREKYLKAGADLVIDCFAQLPEAIEELNRRMQEA